MIRLVPFAFGAHRDLLPSLAVRIERAFRRKVRVAAPGFDPEALFEPARGQYSSTAALEKLLAEPGDEGTILGVTAVDLFVPVLTYVFGEAQLDGRAAVVSLRRLDPTSYGLPADPPLLADRLAKEAIHELGHTYGLLHCASQACVMHASTYAEEIDLKGELPCPACARRILAKEAERADGA